MPEASTGGPNPKHCRIILKMQRKEFKPLKNFLNWQWTLELFWKCFRFLNTTKIFLKIDISPRISLYEGPPKLFNNFLKSLESFRECQMSLKTKVGRSTVMTFDGNKILMLTNTLKC